MIDWTAVIVTVVGPTGVAGAVYLIISIVKNRDTHAREEHAAEAVAHPQSQAGMDHQAIDIAHQAMTQSKNLKAEVDKLSMRLSVVERSYSSLRKWSRRIIREWDTLRHNQEPPELPELHDD